MEVAVKDVIRNIKRIYQDVLCINHLKQCSWHLKNVAELELVEQEGNIKKLFSSEQDQGGSEDTYNHQVSLSYAQLFEGRYNLAKRDIRHLVSGEAGVGKTILCKLIAEDWANGRLFQEFLLVLLVLLNQRGIASVNSLPELLNHLCLFQGDTESCSSLI
jgi:transcriptional regulator of acetoin/glycerol metabolism